MTHMVEPLELGRFISTCRKEKNLTQKQLGEELGVTDRAVSKWENGKSFPDISLIEPLCQILDISVSEFMLGKRIEPEHYQEETEKAWIASLDEPLLYKIQMIIYILGIAAVAVLQVPNIYIRNCSGCGIAGSSFFTRTYVCEYYMLGCMGCTVLCCILPG